MFVLLLIKFRFNFDTYTRRDAFLLQQTFLMSEHQTQIIFHSFKT